MRTPSFRNQYCLRSVSHARLGGEERSHSSLSRRDPSLILPPRHLYLDHRRRASRSPSRRTAARSSGCASSARSPSARSRRPRRRRSRRVRRGGGVGRGMWGVGRWASTAASGSIREPSRPCRGRHIPHFRTRTRARARARTSSTFFPPSSTFPSRARRCNAVLTGCARPPPAPRAENVRPRPSLTMRHKRSREP